MTEETKPEGVRRLATAVLPLTLLILAVAPQATAGRDYMPPELRQRVERLVAEVAAEPTTTGTIAARAAVLWDWANAYALTGEPIPQDLPIMIARVGVVDAPAGANDAAWLAAFDGWVRELELLDERPDALGSIRLSHRGPFPARSRVTLEQTWVVGSVPMVAGGAIRIGIDGFNDQGVLQTANPSGDDYLSIRSSNPTARFVPGPGAAGLSLATRYIASFTLEGATLSPGDTVTITYGDGSGGSRGFALQSWSIDELLLPIYFDLEGKGHFMTPRWASVEVVGMAEVASVRATAPSVVRPGESFALAVRSEDRYYNRSSGPIPAYEVSLDGRVVASIPAGDKGLTVVEGLSIAEPGVHRFEVRATSGAAVAGGTGRGSDAAERGSGAPARRGAAAASRKGEGGTGPALTGTSNPIWAEVAPATRIFWGDTHGHTQYSEGQGSPENYFRFARDDARLDFVVLSEHDVWTDDYEWQTMRELAESFREDGSFLPFLGYEWTVPPARGGHHNVVFRRDVDWRVSAQIAPELGRLYRALRRAYAEDDVLVIPHAHAPGDWRQSDPAIERLIEIASTHGTFEFFGNRYLEEGWQVGFIGSTDNHHGHPGYPDTGTTFHTERNGVAAVEAPVLERDALFAAMRDLRAYATSGEHILLAATLAGAPMGTRLDASAERRIAVRASGTAPIEAIDVIKNGDVAYHRGYVGAGLAPDSWVRVAFASSSEVREHRAPREYRTFAGSIEVAGARLEELRSPGVENRHMESVERDPAHRGRVDLTLVTRGRANVVLLRLTGATPETTLRVQLDESRIGPARDKGPVLPAEDFAVRLGDASAAAVVRPLAGSTDLEPDTVTIELVDLAAPLDQTLEWTDLGPAAPGDYYYVRVTQIDGARAWSSPFWVGGEARRADAPASP